MQVLQTITDDGDRHQPSLAPYTTV